jgi:hypothetical protein
MAPAPLRYVTYAESAEEPNVVVDGSPNAATVLTVSHWPGMPVPPGCEADTSAEMVLRYLDRGGDLHAGAAVVTNNHYDQDGVAGIYALVQPDDALRRRGQVADLARAGDFAVFADRSSARLSMALGRLADRDRTPLEGLARDHGEACGQLYRAALERLPRWFDDPEVCRSLWADEDAELDAGLAALASGAVTVTEQPELDLAVVTLPVTGRSGGQRFVGRRFDGVHPMALHGATDRTVILVIDPGEGRHRLTCRYEGWVQYRSRPIRPRVDLRPLAERLIGLDAGSGAAWTASGPDDLMPELGPRTDGPPSGLDPPVLVAAVADHLRTAAPAWDPYGAPVG